MEKGVLAMDQFGTIENADLIRMYHAKKHGTKPKRSFLRMIAFLVGAATLIAIF